MPNSHKLDYIFIDFDETLFEHYAFAAWIEDLLHEKGELTMGKGSFMASINAYHEVLQQVPLLRLYRHRDHYAYTTKSGWQALSAEIHKQAKTSKADFSYPDAKRFIDVVNGFGVTVKILTYGDQEYQLFKIASCTVSGVAHLETEVILEPKSSYIASTYAGTRGVLVDDKYPLSLPDGWVHIWLDREATLTAPKQLEHGVIKVANLDQALKLIEGLAEK
ncbi:MAG: hypothetical protein KIH63_001970 [Candidatus Saccharibacteria bacterium]|nr:hypothetical protein [Candidatus Saccharibacteria bacterium]